jgi:hypothetical protein
MKVSKKTINITVINKLTSTSKKEMEINIKHKRIKNTSYNILKQWTKWRKWWSSFQTRPPSTSQMKIGVPDLINKYKYPMFDASWS